MPMEFINKEKSRDDTFRKRKDTVLKMTRALSILCDLDACVIIYGPNNQDRPETWPAFPIRTINKYNSMPREKRRILDAAGLDRENQRKVEEKAAKLRQRNDFLVNQWIASLSCDESTKAVAAMDEKIQLLKARIDTPKAEGFTTNEVLPVSTVT